MQFLAQYSTTNGDMWVSEGEFATAGKAKHALRAYRKAGHLCRVIRFQEGCPTDAVSNLITQGLAEVCD